MCRPRRSKGGIADGLLPNHVTFDRCALLGEWNTEYARLSAVTLLHRYGVLAHIPSPERLRLFFGARGSGRKMLPNSLS